MTQKLMPSRYREAIDLRNKETPRNIQMLELDSTYTKASKVLETFTKERCTQKIMLVSFSPSAPPNY